MLRTVARSVGLAARAIPKRYFSFRNKSFADGLTDGLTDGPLRTFTQSAIARNTPGIPSSLRTFTEEELMLKETGKRGGDCPHFGISPLLIASVC